MLADATFDLKNVLINVKCNSIWKLINAIEVLFIEVRVN